MPNPQQIYTSVAAAQTDFSIPFSYLRPEDLAVTVNGVAVSWSLVGSSTARLAVATVGGETVIVKRVTDTDDAFATFTSVITPTNLNNTVLQMLYGLQEINFRVDSLNLADLDPDYVPPATATDKILLSQADGAGGFEWTAVDKSVVASGAFTLDPVGQPDNAFIVVVDDALEWKTKTQVQAILAAGGISLPDPTGAGSQFISSNVAGNGYELLVTSAARSRLGLGTAAVKNAGVTPGTLLTIDNDVNYGGVSGEAALPVIRKGGLLGVPETPTYATFRRVFSATGAENTLNGGDDLLKYGSFEGTAPAWAAAYNAGGSDNVGVELLTAGTYEIEVESASTRASVFTGSVQIELSGGTTTTSKGIRHRSAFGGGGPNELFIRHTLRVTVLANTFVRAKFISSADVTTIADAVGETVSALWIKKVA